MKGQPNSAMDDAALRRSMHLVQCFVLLGLVWKWKLFVHVNYVYFAFPQSDSFFPEALQWSATLQLAYCFSVFGALASIMLRSVGPLRLVILAQVAALSTLLVHQGSYNDATFLTSWWAATWCLWVAGQLNRADPRITRSRAERLACVILSLVMLGPAIGKWTAAYWSGEVFYEIYYRGRDFWVYNAMRQWFDDATLHSISCFHSRSVIVIESIAGLTLWALPPRVVGWIGAVLMLAIPLTNNWLLFSVTLSLLGLAMALIRRRPRVARTQELAAERC